MLKKFRERKGSKHKELPLDVTPGAGHYQCPAKFSLWRLAVAAREEGTTNEEILQELTVS